MSLFSPSSTDFEGKILYFDEAKDEMRGYFKIANFFLIKSEYSNVKEVTSPSNDIDDDINMNTDLPPSWKSVMINSKLAHIDAHKVADSELSMTV